MNEVVLKIMDSNGLPLFVSKDLNQEERANYDLVSGSYAAVQTISRMVNNPLEHLKFKNSHAYFITKEEKNTELFLIYECGHYFRESVLKKRVNYVFDNYFSNFIFDWDPNLNQVNNENNKVKKNVNNYLNDKLLLDLFNNNKKLITKSFNPLIEDESVFSYAVTSFCNNIFYSNDEEGLVEKCLSNWNISNLSNNVAYSVNLNNNKNPIKIKGEISEIYSVVFNTSFRVKEDSENPLLIYFFLNNNESAGHINKYFEIFKEEFIEKNKKNIKKKNIIY